MGDAAGAEADGAHWHDDGTGAGGDHHDGYGEHWHGDSEHYGEGGYDHAHDDYDGSVSVAGEGHHDDGHHYEYDGHEHHEHDAHYYEELGDGTYHHHDDHHDGHDEHAGEEGKVANERMLVEEEKAKAAAARAARERPSVIERKFTELWSPEWGRSKMYLKKRLWEAAMRGNIGRVQRVLQEAHDLAGDVARQYLAIQIDPHTDQGALSYAIQGKDGRPNEKGWPGLVALLLLKTDQTSVINQPDRATGATPLHLAVQQPGAQARVCAALILKGAELDSKDTKGRTTFEIAKLQTINTEVTRILHMFRRAAVIGDKEAAQEYFDRYPDPLMHPPGASSS